MRRKSEQRSALILERTKKSDLAGVSPDLAGEAAGVAEGAKKTEKTAGMAEDAKKTEKTAPADNTGAENGEMVKPESLADVGVEKDRRTDEKTGEADEILANGDAVKDGLADGVVDDELEIGSVVEDRAEEGENKDTELSETKKDSALVASSAVLRADPEKKALAEVKQPKARHHKLFPLLWWVLGVVSIVLVAVAAAGVLGVFGGENEPVAVVDGEPTETPAEPEQPAEEQPEEEKPAEEEKPEEPAPEPEQPPKAVEVPVTPIDPRPGNTADPEVTPGSKLIALTFDDGPSAATTPRLLDILKGRNTKATFFVLGTMAQRSPDLLRREMNEGHEVASHTPYHNQLTTLTPAQVRAEALEMDRIFKEILGTVPPFTRPPYGSFNAAVGEALGQPMVLWSIDPRDWQDRNATTVCNRVVGAARDGAIILVHDIHATTVDAVPCIIDTLKAQGYEFLTVSELAAARDVPLVSGTAYYSF